MNAPTVASMVGMLLIIPAVIVLFAKLAPTPAALYSVVGAILFGPERVSIAIPFISPIDKSSLVCLCAFIGLCVKHSKRLRKAGLFGSKDVLLVALVVTGWVSVLLNRDVLVYGATTLAGFEIYHIVRALVGDLLAWIIPYWIGRICFQTQEDARILVKGFATLAIAYLPLILIELRFSPQMHNWVYGFAQHDFIQTIRAGGYRPMVFMAHGLALAIFLFTAASLAWAAREWRLKWFSISSNVVAIVLSITIVAIKSFGALLFLALMLLLIWRLSARAQLRVAVVIGVLAFTYPMLRATDTFPTTSLVESIRGQSQDRSASLEFRFMNEDTLLIKAMQRPYFGWGGNGRGRVFDAEGADVSVTDGAWILFFGERGAVGYILRFGLLLYPVWRSLRKFSRLGKSMHCFTAGLALTLTMSVVDLIPNGLFNAIPVVLAGALVGLTDRTHPSEGVVGPNAAVVRALVIRRLLLAMKR